METSEVLNRAADLIEERGWTAGGEGWWRPERDGAPLCAEGAIQAVLGDCWRESVALVALRGFIGCGSVSRWNDDQLFGFASGNPFEHDSGRARVWARGKVVGVLRAAALVEAARETTVQVVTPTAVVLS